jgi:hypothetical protein
MGEFSMKIQTLVVCLAVLVAGCGSAGSGSTASNVTMQGGQWEYVVIPNSDTVPLYIDTNLPSTNATLTDTNVVIFHPAEVGLPQIGLVNSAGPIYCSGVTLNATISNSTLSGKFTWGQSALRYANFSGQLAPNGQSIPKGTFSGGACLGGSGGPEVQGGFTGYTVAAVNGTFTGTLNSNLYGADVVTLTITQNTDFTLKISGTSVENGVTTILVPSAEPGNNVVTGAIIFLDGSAQTVNGSEPFTISAHLNPTATQLTITYMNFGANENVTGALTKQ